MRLNRKGFTLIELLATITILAVVSSITLGIVNFNITSAKEKSKNLTISNVEKQAYNYILENINPSIWLDKNGNKEYQCIQIKKLIDAGYIKQTDINNNRDILSESMYIQIERDKSTKTITKQELVRDETLSCPYVSNNNIVNCTISQNDEWTNSKDVTLLYKISSNNDDMIYDNYIGQFELLNNINATIIDNLTYIPSDEGENVFNFTPNFSDTSNIVNVHLKVTSNGIISSKLLYNLGVSDTISGKKSTVSTELASSVCHINKIDSVLPSVELIDSDYEDAYDTLGNITIPIVFKDNESGIDINKIDKSNIVPLLNNNEINKTSINLLCDSNNINIYQCSIVISNIKGVGNLSLKFKKSSFYDRTGNTNEETVLNTNILIDTDSPNASLIAKYYVDGNCQGSYDGSWTNSSICLEGTATKSTGTINMYSFNNSSTDFSDLILIDNPVSTFTAYKYLVSTLSKEFYFHAMDYSGNMSTSNKINVMIDKKIPKITVENQENKNITIKFEDNNSGLKEYLISTSETGKYMSISGSPKEKTISYTVPNYGKYYIIVHDVAGNEKKTTVTINDSTQNIIDINLNATVGNNDYDGNWTNQNVVLTGIASSSKDNIVGYCFSTTSYCSSFTEYSGLNITKTKTLGNTNKTYYFIVKTSSGEITASDGIMIRVDNESPTLKPASFSGGTYNTWTNQNITLTLTGNDDLSGVDYYEYSSDSGETYTRMNSNMISFTNSVNKKYYFRVVDKAGNVSSDRKYTIKIDKIKPTCSVTNMTSGGSEDGVNLKISCSDSGGSGCIKQAYNYYNIKAGDKTYTVEDNVGNKGTCNVKVYANRRRSSCKWNNWYVDYDSCLNMLETCLPKLGQYAYYIDVSINKWYKVNENALKLDFVYECIKDSGVTPTPPHGACMSEMNLLSEPECSFCTRYYSDIKNTGSWPCSGEECYIGNSCGPNKDTRNQYHYFTIYDTILY